MSNLLLVLRRHSPHALPAILFGSIAAVDATETDADSTSEVGAGSTSGTGAASPSEAGTGSASDE